MLITLKETEQKQRHNNGNESSIGYEITLA